MIHRGGPRDISCVLKRGTSAPRAATDSTALLRRVLSAVEVLAGVARLVAHPVQQFVEAHCEERAEKRPDKVDPEIAWEVAVHDCWAEGAGEVEGPSGEVDAYSHTLDSHHMDTIGPVQTAEFRQEERESDPNGS